MSKPTRLCAHDLPSGKPCRQVALKGEPGCRHHMRLFRHVEAELMHEEAMAVSKPNSTHWTSPIFSALFNSNSAASKARSAPTRKPGSPSASHSSTCGKETRWSEPFNNSPSKSQCRISIHLSSIICLKGSWNQRISRSAVQRNSR